MARSRFTDYFSSNKFHLIDVSFSLPIVLLPTFGFTSITAPEITMEMEDVKEGTYEFPRKVNKGKGTLSTITLRQGMQFINSDMWDWMRKAITGNVPRRNLLLVHLSSIALGAGGEFQPSLGFATGLVDFALRVPGRAWLLMGCVPSRLKMANDFDAMDTSISISELDLDYEALSQFDTGV